MTKYIDANSFLEYEENRCKNSPPLIGTCSFDNADLREELVNFPAADVESVRHGHWTEIVISGKELIRALRGTQSRSKRALLDEAAERILDYAVDFACPKPDKYQAKCGSVLHSIGECRTCWERYLAEEAGDE